MNQTLYAIYDVKSESPVGVMHWMSTDAQAVRAFEQIVKTPGTMIYDHPDDFVLISVGRICFDTMVIDPILSPLSVPVAYGHMIARALSRARDDVSVETAQ